MARFFALSCAAAVLAGKALAQEASDLAGLLSLDDECAAGDAEACALNAVQLRGLKRATLATDTAARQGLHGKARAGVAGALEAFRAAPDDGASEECKAMKDAAASCLPATTDPEKISFADSQAMCGCKGKFEALATKCPAYQKLSSSLTELLGGLCSDCGTAVSKVVFSHKCEVGTPDSQGVTPEVACGADCHDGFCGVLAACPAGQSVQGLFSAEDVDEARKNITASMSTCACTAASALQVQRTSLSVQARTQSRVGTLGGAFAALAAAPSTDGGCEEFRATLMPCLPSSTNPDKMTMNDLTTMCGCQDQYQQLGAKCPELKDQAETLLDLMTGLCSKCGLAAGAVYFSPQHQCSIEAPSAEVACSAACHAPLCKVLADCPAKTAVGDIFSAEEVDGTRANITEATATCSCSAASALEVSSATTLTVRRATRGRLSSLGRGLEAATGGDACEALNQELMPCFPEDFDTMSQADLKTLCGCKEKLAKLPAACPDQKAENEDLVGIVDGMCSTCGLAFGEVSFKDQGKCASEDEASSKIACDAECHDSFCNVLKACPAGKAAGGAFSAADIDSARENITAITASCPCA